jgi:hypothetical protein
VQRPNAAILPHASNINRTTSDLTVTSFLFGVRYSRRHGKRRLPFAQLLLGGAHANGGLTPAASGLAGSENFFALAVGGGMDILLTRNLGLRRFPTDYYLTRFSNGSNDHPIAASAGASLGGRAVDVAIAPYQQLACAIKAIVAVEPRGAELMHDLEGGAVFVGLG